MHGRAAFLTSVLALALILALAYPCDAMSIAERRKLRSKAKDMFYHGYKSYMKYAYPADELMPLSCKGRIRGFNTDRGDMDDALGRFSLTLVDSMDTLAIMGDYDAFMHAVHLVSKDVKFDTDVVVSVFETNIRMVGGLISAHVLAEEVVNRSLGTKKHAYDGALLRMAVDIASRLLPAFETPTGIPYARVNLRTGMDSREALKDFSTCTACAGSMILEFGALSRLTRNSTFEEKARHAMRALWSRRSSDDLVGNVIHTHTGQWLREDSGIGAGIDSYYEYLFKAYMLLGEHMYLDVFNTHYSAIMTHVKRGPWFIDTRMNHPGSTNRNNLVIDALSAFWPGLQVLKGDVDAAKESYVAYLNVVKRYGFIPEGFTADHRLHWSHSPLRPEFIESTYYLYHATKDPFYLEVGKLALEKIESTAKVVCGWAAIADVSTMRLEDRMDSFVLSETFKYLYLLFDEADREKGSAINVDDYVFTTEAHLMPLHVSTIKTNTRPFPREVTLSRRTNASNTRCLALSKMARDREFVKTVLQGNVPLSVDATISSSSTGAASGLTCPLENADPDDVPFDVLELNPNNQEHVNFLAVRGVDIKVQGGQMHLTHTPGKALTTNLAAGGQRIMEEVMRLAQGRGASNEITPKFLHILEPSVASPGVYPAGPALFGPAIMGPPLTGRVVETNPSQSCSTLVNADEISGRIALVERGGCMFVDKVKVAQAAGAAAVIICDNQPTQEVFAMRSDSQASVKIPSVFASYDVGRTLRQLLSADPAGLLYVALSEKKEL